MLADGSVPEEPSPEIHHRARSPYGLLAITIAVLAVALGALVVAALAASPLGIGLGVLFTAFSLWLVFMTGWRASASIVFTDTSIIASPLFGDRKTCWSWSEVNAASALLSQNGAASIVLKRGAGGAGLKNRIVVSSKHRFGRDPVLRAIGVRCRELGIPVTGSGAAALEVDVDGSGAVIAATAGRADGYEPWSHLPALDMPLDGVSFARRGMRRLIVAMFAYPLAGWALALVLISPSARVPLAVLAAVSTAVMAAVLWFSTRSQVFSGSAGADAITARLSLGRSAKLRWEDVSAARLDPPRIVLTGRSGRKLVIDISDRTVRDAVLAGLKRSGITPGQAD
jgi:hypothetical protein